MNTVIVHGDFQQDITNLEHYHRKSYDSQSTQVYSYYQELKLACLAPTPAQGYSNTDATSV